MLTLRIIPCLDVRDGRVVKGVRFANLRDAGTPETLAARYEQEGADELVMLDVSATPEGRAASLETVRRIRRAIGIPLTVGGGVRRTDDAAALLDAGADKVGSQHRGGRESRAGRRDRRSASAGNASSWPSMRRRMATVGGSWSRIPVAAARSKTLPIWAAEAEAAGAGEILLTSFDRDGTRSGYDLPLLRATDRRGPRCR